MILEQDYQVQCEAAEEKLEPGLPGLYRVREAYAEYRQWSDEKALRTFQILAARYPKALAWIRADEQASTNPNPLRRAAGEKAKTLLLAGGTFNEAYKAMHDLSFADIEEP